jgi:hypothetical protein
MTQHPGIRARIEASADTARLGSCRRCGRPVYTARVGRVASVDVIVDTEPIPSSDEPAIRATGRLTWRLIVTTLGPRRIASRDTHVPTGRPILADHTCPVTPIQEALL